MTRHRIGAARRPSHSPHPSVARLARASKPAPAEGSLGRTPGREVHRLGGPFPSAGQHEHLEHAVHRRGESHRCLPLRGHGQVGGESRGHYDDHRLADRPGDREEQPADDAGKEEE